MQHLLTDHDHLLQIFHDYKYNSFHHLCTADLNKRNGLGLGMRISHCSRGPEEDGHTLARYHERVVIAPEYTFLAVHPYWV
jgi:hypothetical protein